MRAARLELERRQQRLRFASLRYYAGTRGAKGANQEQARSGREPSACEGNQADKGQPALSRSAPRDWKTGASMAKDLLCFASTLCWYSRIERRNAPITSQARSRREPLCVCLEFVAHCLEANQADTGQPAHLSLYYHAHGTCNRSKNPPPPPPTSWYNSTIVTCRQICANATRRRRAAGIQMG